jgi:hypothetical protein
MPAWSQASGGPLAESEIDDLTAFILTWSGTPGQPIIPTADAAAQGQGLAWWVWILVAIIFIALIAAIVLGSRQRQTPD